MRYRVYLWKTITSQEAEIVQAVEAVSSEAALQAAMRAANLSYANFAWIVPDDDDVADVQRARVRCSSTRRPGH